MPTYAQARDAAAQDSEAYWLAQSAALDWDVAPSTALDASRPPYYRWFADGRLNTCYNALDRHIAAGRGDACALIVDSPLAGRRARYSYRELRDAVAQCAGALRALGVATGDRVVIYLPMVAEAAIAMLACARIGAVHSVVFGGFAAVELAKRIDDATPKLLITASCGLEPGRIVPYKGLVDEALLLAQHRVPYCLLLQRPEAPCAMIAGRDVDWQAAMAAAEPADCVSLAATDPLYVLYTSGTTGKPKGVVRDQGSHAVGLLHAMRTVFNTGVGEVFWAASDVGWVVGHSFIVYGPLLAGCTTVMYEGKPVGTPDAGAFWRVIAEYGVKTFFTAPTAFRAIKKEDPEGLLLKQYDLSRFQALFLAGERSDPDTITWAQRLLGVPVVDNWWQTELGLPTIANCLGLGALPVKPGSPTVPVPGCVVCALDDQGAPVAAGAIGNLVLKLPLPPGALATLWNNEQGYFDSYLARYPGYYLTGDAGIVDADGYIWVMSRIDDIINVAGHRLSTGAMEEALSGHPAVAECAVIGVADALKGQVPVGLVVLKSGAQISATVLEAELVQRVRSQIGAVAAFKQAAVVARLPKTRSGKVLRATMRAIADQRPYSVPATIDDPKVLDEIAAVLGQLSARAG